MFREQGTSKGGKIGEKKGQEPDCQKETWDRTEAKGDCSPSPSGPPNGSEPEKKKAFDDGGTIPSIQKAGKAEAAADFEVR